MTSTEKAAQIKREIHTALIELGALADAEDKVLYINIQGDYLCPTGNVGANIITQIDIKIEEI